MSYNFSKDGFEKFLNKTGKAVLFKKIPADTITPVLASLKVAQHFSNGKNPYHFLLETFIACLSLRLCLSQL
jgi:hypothetical protein